MSLKIVIRQNEAKISGLLSLQWETHASEETLAEALVLDLYGSISLGDGSMALREAVQILLAGGARTIHLDLAEVVDIDSSGIAELVSAFTRVKSMGGDLKLLNPSYPVYEILEITRLSTVIEVLQEAAEAGRKMEF